MQRRVLFAAALAAMYLLRTWRNWAQRRERDVLYAALQLAWWVGGPVLSSLHSAFRGSARRTQMKAIKPRRARFTLLARPS